MVDMRADSAFLLFLTSLLFQLFLISSLNLYNIIFIFVFLNAVLLLYMASPKYLAKLLPLWILFVLAVSGFSIAPYEILANLHINLILPITLPSLVMFIISVMLIMAIGLIASLLAFDKIENLERLIASYALGTGIVSVMMMLLGTLSKLTVSTVLASYGILFVLLLALCRKKLTQRLAGFGARRIDFPKLNLYPILLALPFVIFSIVHAIFMPDMYTDSLIYGNNLAKLIFDNNRIPFIAGGPSIGIELSANYPPSYQLLGVFAYFISGGENQAFLKLFSFIDFLFLSALTYLWADRLFKNKALSALAVLLLVISPISIVHSRVASFYMHLILNFSLAIYFLEKFISTKNRAFLIAGAAFGSFAALTSYLGLLVVPLALSILFYFKAGKRNTFVFLLVFIILIQPWYMRNLILLGNPVWPFGGGNFIDPLISQNTQRHLNEQSMYLGFNYESLQDLSSSIKRILFSYIDFFDSTVSTGLKPFLALFALPAIFLWFRKRDPRFDIFIIWLAFIILVHVSVFYMFERYLSLALLPTIFLSVFLLQGAFKIKAVKIFFIIIIGLLSVNSLFVSAVWNECIGADREKAASFISNIGNYDKILETCYRDDAKMWKWVNENVKSNELVATSDFRLYYINRSVINLDSWKLRQIFYAKSVDEIIDVLKKNGVDYLVADIKENIDSPDLHILKEFGTKRIFKLA